MSSPHRHGSLPAHSPDGGAHHHHQLSPTVSSDKPRRLIVLLLFLRFAAFCFSFTAAVFMVADSSRSPTSYHTWADFDSFRFVFAANAIVAVYSLAEMGVAAWEILRGVTALPEAVQLCFDFGHDQVFAYVLLAAEAAGTVEMRGLRRGRACEGDNTFCTQAYISVGLGFAGFVFLALSALLSGYRVACYVITGARLPL